MKKLIVALLLGLNQVLLLWLIYSNIGGNDIAEYIGQVEERVVSEQWSASTSLERKMIASVGDARQHLSHSLVSSMLLNFEKGVHNGVLNATDSKSLLADARMSGFGETLDQLEGTVRRVLPTQRKQVERLTEAVQDSLECNEAAARIFEGALAKQQQQQRNGDGDASCVAGGNWLLIGIPTVPRRNNVDYLKMTLSRLADDLPRHDADALLGAVRVVVVNNRPGDHRVYEDVRRRFELANDEAFDFADGPSGYSAWPLAYESLLRGSNARPRRVYTRPTPTQQAQTRDVIGMLQHVHANYAGQYRYFMFMEDDFLVCPHALLALQYAMRKASSNMDDASQGDWTGLRCSFGLNGVVVRMADLRFLIDYMSDSIGMRPPDHLVTEWLAKETPGAAAYFGPHRTIAAFKYNLFHHIGRVSSLRKVESPDYPECYEPLVPPTIFDVESWTPKKCPDDDVLPCRAGQGVSPDGLVPWDQFYKPTRCTDEHSAPAALEQRPLVDALAASIDSIAVVQRGSGGGSGLNSAGTTATAVGQPGSSSSSSSSVLLSSSSRRQSSSAVSAMRDAAAKFSNAMAVDQSSRSSVVALETKLAEQLTALAELRQRIAGQLGSDAIKARADKLEADGVIAEQRHYIEQMSAALTDAHQRVQVMQSLVDTAQAQLDISRESERLARGEIDALRLAAANKRPCPAPPSFDKLSQEAREFIEQQLAEQVERALANEARRRQEQAADAAIEVTNQLQVDIDSVAELNAQQAYNAEAEEYQIKNI